MPLNLNNFLSVSADEPDLEHIQENIIRSTGRHRSQTLFLQIENGGAIKARTFLRQLASSEMSSARDQFAAIRLLQSGSTKAKKDKNVNRTSTTLAISKSGYLALEIPTEKIPTDPAFNAGMQARSGLLNDKPAKVEAHFKNRIDIVISIGANVGDNSDTSAEIEKEAKALVKRLPAGGLTLIHRERGRGYSNAAHEGIEHFGYMDGRSQPLMWAKDVAEEPRLNPPNFVWDPSCKLNQALVIEPGSGANPTYGSYFVFRKLEQSVARFKERERAVFAKIATEAKKAALPSPPDELAGAMLVGRFENGIPVADPIAGVDVQGASHNDFDYSNDPSGGKCPFFAHIRKTNPRSDIGNAAAKIRMMARRGITYGLRDHDPETGEFVDEHPNEAVGLLFMAYMNSIEDQFEFIQRSWANDENFSSGDLPGIDPVIGQGTGSRQYKFPLNWGNASAKSSALEFKEFVTFRGGEYFFAPSLTFLKSLPI
jgi:Dyp-type peroxidase family